ncbi:UbiX family flavin prenyltransferase [Aspergillus brunneoviolaceus CBS 621.78]|uniref:Phenylacrylic acid decarboxylase n=1 Tax=Aspergillus brunneoviolaceus CBS 621.78 TaxID=1450534 RepID=A0ACD1GE95_9EURO|nr:Phenylacrylic acid decarboxylase [Aspergillus brunneoviolaceus CBS 621.78]RAH47500.1 Phenylacrylic acid decarboxylase [Aspergillus brunneoviolaceus CBS 621.78]
MSRSRAFCRPWSSPLLRRAIYSPSVASKPKRIIVGITGATGAASITIKYETEVPDAHLRSLATYNYSARDLAAPISSGSFLHDGMIVIPCSIKTLAAVRMGYYKDLIARAADVSLKKGRKLILVVRETPLSKIYLENMLALRRAGAVIFPPVPAFYTKPQGLDNLVDQSIIRMLDNFGITLETSPR